MTDPKTIYVNLEFPENPNPKEVFNLSELAFKYIYHLHKSSKIISDGKAQAALNFLLNHTKNNDFIIEISLKYELDKILILVLENIYQRLLKVFQHEDENGEIDDVHKKHKIGYIALAIICTNLIERYSANSEQFCHTFQHDTNHGVRVLFNLINNRKIQEKFINTIHHRTGQEYILLRNMLRSTLLSLAHLARFGLGHRKQWKEANAVKNLLFYFERNFIELDLKIEIGLAIAYIADEDDIDTTGFMDKDVMALLTRMISIASKKIKSGTELNRFKGLEEASNSCSVTVKQSQWTLVTVLNGLQNISVHPDVKCTLFYDLKMSKYLREIIYHGSEYEKERAIYILWELCFDQEIAANVSNDRQLVDYLRQLDQNKEEFLLSKYSGGILFQTQSSGDQMIRTQFEEAKKIRLISEINGRELSTRIDSELDKYNFYIARDGKTSEIIEDSICLIVFLTGWLKYSPECRSEIEYALALNKQIIFILVEENYKPDGWIGNLIDKLKQTPIDFTSMNFFDGVEMLKSQLEVIFKSNKIKLQEPKFPADRDVSQWDEVDVDNWLNALKFHPGLKASLKSCDGKLLQEIYEMRQDAPIFMLELMKSKIGEDEAMKFNLFDFNYFTKELTSLFDNK